MDVEGVRPRGRPKLRYMYTIKGDIKKNGLSDVNIFDRNDWSFQGDPLTWKSLQAEKNKYIYIYIYVCVCVCVLGAGYASIICIFWIPLVDCVTLPFDLTLVVLYNRHVICNKLDLI